MDLQNRLELSTNGPFASHGVSDLCVIDVGEKNGRGLCQCD